MQLALIGLGKWGTNIKKTLESLGVEVIGVDKNSPLTEKDSKGIAGVLVATPGSTHAQIALPFITQGSPVFIEKPMTTSLKDALKLQKAVEKSGSQVFVGHLHLYNPAFLATKELIKKSGKIRYVSFEGMNWGPFRDDMSAMWDWAPHDVAMALELFGKPLSVQAWGTRDWAEIKLLFAPPAGGGDARGGGSFPVLIHVTWLSPEKKKKMTVVGEKYTVVLDDTKVNHPPSPKASAGQGKITMSREDVFSYPEYEATMPLTAELQAFLEMIKTGKKPKTDIQNGLDVVSILDAAERSMTKNGSRVTL